MDCMRTEQHEPIGEPGVKDRLESPTNKDANSGLKFCQSSGTSAKIKNSGNSAKLEIKFMLSKI